VTFTAVLLILLQVSPVIAQGKFGQRRHLYEKSEPKEKQSPSMPGRLEGMGHLLQLADELDLTESQQNQLRELHLKFATEQVDRDAELKKTRIQLHALMTDKSAAESDVLRTIDQMAKVRADQLKSRYLHHREMKGVLTAEQLDQVEQLYRERWKERGDDKKRDRDREMRGDGFGFDEDDDEDFWELDG
jgi:Spy/CpxP family protein refolding chaperone